MEVGRATRDGPESARSGHPAAARAGRTVTSA